MTSLDIEEEITEKKKLLKKVRIDEKLREKNHAIASLHAQSNGYKILNRIIADDCFVSVWRFYRTGELCGPKPHQKDQFAVLLDMDHGQIEMKFYGFSVLGCLTGGGGLAMAIAIKDLSTSEVQWLALGEYNGVSNYVSLPSHPVLDACLV